MQWAPNDSLVVSAGRLDFLFAGLERTIGSTRITTIERGLVANQTMPGEVVAVLVEGTRPRGSYRVGLLGGSIAREFTDFSGGIGIVAGVSRDLPLGYERGKLHVDYLFNDGNSDNNALKPYDHQLSVWHRGQLGALDMGVEMSWSHGVEDRPAVFGATLLPTFTIAKRVLREQDAVQVALRYQFATSDGDNGLELQKRYEQDVVRGFGDRYQAAYGGINYLAYSDRLKLMIGLEYSDMHDEARDGGAFAGWTYFGAARVFF